MRAVAVIGCGAVLAACAVHLRVALPDEQRAIVAATQLCGWAPADHEGHLHAELTADKWHVWDDRGGTDAYLNRFDTGSTFVCVAL